MDSNSLTVAFVQLAQAAMARAQRGDPQAQLISTLASVVAQTGMPEFPSDTIEARAEAGVDVKASPDEYDLASEVMQYAVGHADLDKDDLSDQDRDEIVGDLESSDRDEIVSQLGELLR